MADTWKPNDPAPQDLSLVEEQPDPIKVPAQTVASIGNYETKNQIRERIVTNNQPDWDVTLSQEVDETTGITKFKVGRTLIKDNGSSNKSISNDVPEESSFVPETLSDRQLLALSGKSQEKNIVSELFPGLPLTLDTGTITINSGNTVSGGNANTSNFSLNPSVPINISPNELDNFSSYTYNISLYMLNSNSYVNLLTAPRNPQAVLEDSLLLMRSAGVGLDNRDNELERQLGFFNNFFIDDLEVENVAVGPSKFKQNTNATNIRFTILEPRGVTLLEKLSTAAQYTLSSTGERYIHAPYLLEISFKGYDDTGKPLPAPSRPKYIPIRITDISFDVTEMGTQYKVEAIPFANHVFGKITSTIETNIEVRAETVGDVFSQSLRSIVDIEEREERYVGSPSGSGGTEFITTKKQAYAETSKNLGEILTQNQFMRTQWTKGKNGERTGPAGPSGGYEVVDIPPVAELNDTYTFSIGSEIANAKINMIDLRDSLNSPVPKGEGNNDGKANQSQFKAYAYSLRDNVKIVHNDSGQQVFRINAGTDITKLLNLIIMHSDYMDKNVLEDNEGSSTRPVKWFKVRPTIMAGRGYDSKDGRYKYDIQFSVVPSVIHYVDYPWAPTSIPTGNGVHKVYDYIYSGTNTQVLDFKLQFRTAFIQTMTAGTGSPYGLKDKKSHYHFVPQVQELPQSIEGNTINPGPDEIRRRRAKDLFSSVMSDGVDMVDLNMQIVGDPAYIPTSDAYWQDKIRQGTLYNSAYMPDGTINFDYSPPYIQVNLKTPVDYDETTGLANPNQYGNSSFSGVYRITSIESSFSGGQFIQRLNGFRPPAQDKALSIDRDNKSFLNEERSVLQYDLDKIGSNLINTAWDSLEKKSSPVISRVLGNESENEESVISQAISEVLRDQPRIVEELPIVGTLPLGFDFDTDT